MVKSSHEAMHRIFQHDPGLFSRVSRVLGIPIAAPVKVAVLPTDLTETNPVERRVDTLLRLETAEQGAFLLAVEAQGRPASDKPASWAYYVSFLWSKYRLPTALLVVCQDRGTAHWAQRPVSSGPPGLPTLTVQPVVAGPHNMPVITDPEEARADLALATLAAITHAANPDIGTVLRALSTALKDVPEDEADPIIEFTAQGMGKRPAKDLWRKLVAVDLSFYKSYLSEEIRDEGRVQGRAQGRDEGRAEGRAEDILFVLEQRGLDFSDDVRTRVTDCIDPETLRQWLARALTAATAEDIFGEEG
ncbi:hypothetical protein [Streptomyces montanisoli]|uniref:Rpn family recombination-promoting nuclease/putative transposase n=1 Tax=Streptomyces montanisoli TaxID=2798581 RepID=A0A940ME19_9ACTN|nr:hypothetical protein [Streptomyces montanisoli]MBP0461250.1 hypothetical protein [Streptomyces montanisoli]